MSIMLKFFYQNVPNPNSNRPGHESDFFFKLSITKPEYMSSAGLFETKKVMREQRLII